jgi:hypothetical protein
VSVSDHTPAVCTNRDCLGCMFCEGGLFGCTVCGSFEGAATTDCPGVLITSKEKEAIYAGEMDYRDEQWVQQPSEASPAWLRRSIEGRRLMAEVRRS